MLYELLDAYLKNALFCLFLLSLFLFHVIQICVLLTVMEAQTAIMDMDVFQTRLGVMLQ